MRNSDQIAIGKTHSTLANFILKWRFWLRIFSNSSEFSINNASLIKKTASVMTWVILQVFGLFLSVMIGLLISLMTCWMKSWVTFLFPGGCSAYKWRESKGPSLVFKNLLYRPKVKLGLIPRNFKKKIFNPSFEEKSQKFTLYMIFVIFLKMKIAISIMVIFVQNFKNHI